MIKKTLIAYLTIASLQSYAEHQFITCDNYKESIIQKQITDYPDELSELDCSDNTIQSISYRTVLKKVDETALYNKIEAINDDRPIADRSLIPLTDEELISRYFPENNEYRDIFSRYSLSKIEQDQVIANSIIREMAYIPSLSINHMLSVADGHNCKKDERYNISSFFRSNMRKSYYIRTSDKSVQVWLIYSCGHQPANLIIKNVDNSLSNINRYSLASIDHSFTHFSGSEPYHEQKFNEIRDISYDGEAVLMQFVLDNSDSGIDGSLHVVSQLAAIVYKNKKLYTLPTQKFINHKDYPRSRLSQDGSKIAVASLKSVKLFEYNAVIDDYVLVGYYKHNGPHNFSPKSIKMSPDGLHVYLYLDGNLHEVEFKK